MFLSVLVLVFIPFLIVWLLSAEFNLLGNDWLVAKNASVWHGWIKSSDHLSSLVNQYHIFWDVSQGDMTAKLSPYIGSDTQVSINSAFTFFNPIILAPLFGLLVWSFVYPIIFNATKVSGVDVLPFSFGIGTFMFVLIISGLMDQWGQQLAPVYWLVRIVIAASATFVVFMITNLCVNKFLASRPYATDIYFGYKEIDKANALAKQQLKDNLGTFKKQKEQDESFVEVKEGQ